MSIHIKIDSSLYLILFKEEILWKFFDPWIPPFILFFVNKN
jgi:hypothetical protein